jgi:ABC-type lipoprotein export system ATPase subunit
MTTSIPRAGLPVSCSEVVHIYRTGGTEVVAVRGVDLTVRAGESVALVGPSGSGKSTLLSLLGGLLSPSAGQVWVGDDEISRLGERELLALRAEKVGFVLQSAARSLLPYATPVDNVRFAQTGRAATPAGDLLEMLGLAELADARLPTLSGGEQQRIAVAVAVANSPGLLLADEPTSQLDAAGRAQVLDLLDRVRELFGTTVLLVTHDADVAARMDRQVAMRYGRVGHEGHEGRQRAVVGKDGAVPLTDDMLADWPPGTLVEVEIDGETLRLRRATE